MQETTGVSPWVTAMQAVAWIMTRDPLIVLMASLVDGDCGLPNEGLGNDGGPCTVKSNGLTLTGLVLHENYDGCGVDGSCDDAIAQFMRALQTGEIQASGERFDPSTQTRSTREFVPAMFWAGLVFDEAPHDQRSLVPYRATALSRPNEDWQNLLFESAALTSKWTNAKTQKTFIASDRNGAPGRPSSKHLVLQEFERRSSQQLAAPTLKEQAEILSAWLKETHPSMAQMTPLTIQNAIRKFFPRK